MSLQLVVDQLGRTVNQLIKCTEEEKISLGFSSKNNDKMIVDDIVEENNDNMNSTISKESIMNSLYQIVDAQLPKVLNTVETLTNKLLNPIDSITRIPIVHPKMHPNPPAPPTLLNINHLRIVYTSIELLWVCKILPYISTTLGNTFDWSDTIYPKSLLINKDSLSKLSFIPLNNSNQTLKYIQCMHSLIINPVFSSNMLSRNLKRVLIALLVLSREEDINHNNQLNSLPLSNYTSDQCTTNIENIYFIKQIDISAKQLLYEVCFNSSNKTFVVSELRGASKGPKWIISHAGKLFSEIILSEFGLQAVLKAYLEGNYDVLLFFIVMQVYCSFLCCVYLMILYRFIF